MYMCLRHVCVHVFEACVCSCVHVCVCACVCVCVWRGEETVITPNHMLQ